MLDKFDPSTTRRLAVLAAMPWECRSVLRQLRQVRRDTLGPFTLWSARHAGFEIVVMKTGIGPRRAKQASSALVAHGPFTLLLSTGCAGGLRAETVPGDLILATHAVDAANGRSYSTDADVTARAGRIARQAGLTIHHGSVVCVERALGTAVEKRAAASQGHVAVEMEGAAIAACAASAGIPYASVRSILDTAETELHDGGFVDPDSGGVRPLALAKFLARQPRALGDLLGMQRMMQAAASSLDRFFAAWIAALDDQPPTLTQAE